MNISPFYPIGIPGQAWGSAERALWRARQVRRQVELALAAANTLFEFVFGIARLIDGFSLLLFSRSSL